LPGDAGVPAASFAEACTEPAQTFVPLAVAGCGALAPATRETDAGAEATLTNGVATDDALATFAADEEAVWPGALAPSTVAAAGAAGALAAVAVAVAGAAGVMAPGAAAVAGIASELAPVTAAVAGATGSLAPLTVAVADTAGALAPFTTAAEGTAGALAPLTTVVAAAATAGALAPLPATVAALAAPTGADAAAADEAFTAAPDASSGGTCNTAPILSRLGSFFMNALGFASNSARDARTSTAGSCDCVAAMARSLSDCPE
jgi:hypothetical protein